MRTAARIISFIFHPLLLTTYIILLLGNIYPSMLMIRPENLRPIASFVFLITFVLPAANLLMFRYFGNISSITLEQHNERTLPFFFIALIYILVTALFYFKLPISGNFIKLMMIITALVIASAIITIFYKVSVHSLALWGFIGILLPLNKVAEDGELLWPTIILIAIAGLVMSSRLVLNVHRPRELLVGSLTGFAVGFVGMAILF